MTTQILNQIQILPATQSPKYKGKSLKSANRFQIDPNRPSIVKGLLLEGQVGMIAGEPNLGKSAIMSCIASHVAMGRNMGDMKVNRAAVLYVAAEDAEGILERAYPFMHNAPEGAAAFEVLDEVPDLTDEAQVQYFIQFAKNFQTHHKSEKLLIIFDTLNLSIGDADENSARDMSKVFKHAQRIAKTTNAHVLFIHHVGTSDKGRPRGSSAMTATLDTLLTLQKAEDGTGDAAMLIQKKQKRIRKGRTLAFRIEAFEAGVDDDGETFTVPMAVPFKHDKSLAVLAPTSEPYKPKPSASAPRVTEVLRLMTSMAQQDTEKWFSTKEISNLVGGPFNDIRDNPEAFRKAIGRALATLEKAGSLQRNAKGQYTISTRVATSNEGTGLPITKLH
ncbi:AAA domain-containing protein [Sulfitobacter brevis]|uniref:AAA domain-containing protein n=1 Tax=Sulfitobacter brevis TaxID=74348 RepID=A0A1I2G211_9RHOB|nr:AAA family ATPase [Sulfitobacter brevis]SFF11582.1 AAA domain-containing protein [Sulfitobacter brevis]